MKLKTRKKMYIIIFIILFIAFIFTKSLARALNSQTDLMSSRNIGNSIELSREGERSADKTSLMWNEHMYCFQHEKYCGEASYTVQAYIEIDGDKATRYYTNDATTGTTVTNNANLGLGYLLEHGTYDKGYYKKRRQTLRQRALWEYGDTWISSVGSSFNMDWTVGAINKDTDSFSDESSYTYKDFSNSAKDYANKGAINNPTVEFINTSKEYDNTSNGTVFGPFKVSFNHDRMKVTSIVLKDSDGKKMSSGISFFSDSAGKNSLNLNNIKSNSSFYIKNTTSSDVGSVTINVETDPIYKAQIWFLYDNNSSDQRLISVKPSSYKKTSSTEIKLTTTGTLYLYKADEETNETLQGAGFKIFKKNSGWQKGTAKPFEYVSNINDATEYVMDNNNKTSYVQYLNYDGSSNEYKNKKVLKISGLKAGIYHIYETKAPTGKYKLDLQNGYDAQNGYVDIGNDIKIGSNKSNGYSFNRLVDITNVQKISIAGYVWTEGKPDKPTDESYDSIYKKSDHRVSNVIVKLMRKDGNNENPPTVTTNENGEYIFKDLVKRTELDKYYVEFDYREGKYSYTLNGETINKAIKDGNGHIKYIPVAFNNVENGSKALAETVPKNDANVTGLANTYKENNDEEVKVYGLSKIGTMDNENLKLNNINLGIKELLEPEFSIVKNIADVDIAINDYNYKYIYGGRNPEEGFAENTQEGPAVKWQNSNVNHAYSRPVYPSDVIYKNSDEKNKELDVKVTYRIDITNTTTYNVKELYVENKLILESILDDFDTNRYTLLDTNWDANNGTASMKSEYLEKIQKEINENKEKGLMSKATATAYITFSVNKNAIIDILNHPEGIIENNPTKVIVKGYHLYNRDDYMWNNLKTNGGQIKVNKEHQTESQTQAAEAPYLVFTIKPDGIIERTISGKVFKDNVTVERGNSGEVVGDGKHQDNEKGIEGVKVELLRGEGNMDVTKLYQLYTENNVDKTRVIDAVVTTNQNGEYSLNGVVPGKYYLRFTYGNGTYKITDLTGTTIKEGAFETKVGENTIVAKDYKSTIMNSEIVNTIKNKAELWYKEDGFKEGKYSLALDNLEKRRELNEAEANKELNDSEKIKEISADTSKISVTIENTKRDEAEETEETTNKQISANNSSGNQTRILLNNQKKNIKFEFGGFYFGLIEMPKQELKIEKLIKNVLIKNGQTNVFYNGNPEEVAKQGAGVATVTDLDITENGGSTYTRVEMVEASISGSDLRIAYEVKITNISDVNYYNEEYYKFGIIDKTKEVTVTPTKVYDYLDEKFKYEPELLNTEKIHEKYKSDKDRIEEYQETDEAIKKNEKELKAKAYKLKGGLDKDEWIALYTDKIKNRDSNHPTSDAVIIVASKLLSSSEYDWVVYNRAEIIDAKLSPSSLDTVNSDSEKERLLKTAAKEIHSNGMVETMFTLTIPTGEDRYSTTLYAIAGIIALIVLSTGIVIIKKKIL